VRVSRAEAGAISRANVCFGSMLLKKGFEINGES
jgi:hypothetical protein